MTPAERLKAARKALGLTERQMAAALGMRGKNAKDDLRKMEEDMRPVTGPVLVAAEALVALQPFAEVDDWARRNGHDLRDFDMLLRGPGEGVAGHLHAQAADFIKAREAMPAAWVTEVTR